MKKRLPLYLLSILFLSAAGSKAQVVCIMCFDQNDSISTGITNLISNGGFENHNCVASTGVIGSPTSFCPNSNGYSCDLVDWTCTGGGTSTYACIYDVITNKSMIQEGSNAVYMGNFYCNACSNSQSDTSCLITNGCAVSGPPPGFPFNPDPAFGGAVGVSIEQTVTGLTVGATYVLEFWAGGEQYMTSPGLFAVNVGFGDTMLRNRNTPVGTGIGTRYLILFNAVSGSHTIKFTNWGHICSNCTELVLDDVRLYTLAELSPTIQPCAGVATVALFTAPNHICPGTCTDFTNLSLNGQTYQWSFPGANPGVSTDVNPTNICYNSPGNYDVELIAFGFGLNVSDTLLLPNYITVYPYPPAQGISQNGDTLFAIAGAVGYQWYHDGLLIPGATNYYYVASEGGNYNVVATDANGCEVEAVIFDVVAGIDGIHADGGISLFPNPVSEILSVNHNRSTAVSRVYVYNVLGEVVLDQEGISVGRSGTAQGAVLINVSGLPAAVYTVELVSGSRVFRRQFVKE